MKIDEKTKTLMAKVVFSSSNSSFEDLCDEGALDKAVDFRFRDLRGIDFGESDLSGWDFTGAKLTGANFDLVTGIREAIFKDALLDPEQIRKIEVGGVSKGVWKPFVDDNKQELE
jgi:uncharacterized protein YjbI with pentapeptide repeats